MEFTRPSMMRNGFPDPFQNSSWMAPFPQPRGFLSPPREWGDFAEDESQESMQPLGFVNEGKEFRVSLQVGDYKPKDIKLTVDGGKLLVSGKRVIEGPNGSESSEFQRQYTLPNDINADSLKSRITNNGVLEIEASRQQGMKQMVHGDEKIFKLVVATNGFKSDNIAVKLTGRNLLVHAEEKEEVGDHYQVKHLKRNFVLPQDVDVDKIKTELQKDGSLIITAPRNQASLPKERILAITRA